MKRWMFWKKAPAPAALGLQPLPREHRALLLSLLDYDEAGGLEGFLDRFDYSGVQPRQVYSLVLGRMPEALRVAKLPADYCARSHFAEMLHSDEFQNDLILRICRAFPEKRRLLFVHVPKCAGTDLGQYLQRDFAHIEQRDQDVVHVPKDVLLARLKAIVTRITQGNEIAIVGHIGLNWLMVERMVRFDDAVFSIVRDPIDMAISKVNYVLTLLVERDQYKPLFIRRWMDLLGIDDYPIDVDLATGREYARSLLLNPKVVPHNNICRFLGRDDVESTLDLCAGSDIELTTVSRYKPWLQARWGIASDSRANESRKFLSRSDLTEAELAHLTAITQKDRVLYEHIESRLAALGTLSLRGSQL